MNNAILLSMTSDANEEIDRINYLTDNIADFTTCKDVTFVLREAVRCLEMLTGALEDVYEDYIDATGELECVESQLSTFKLRNAEIHHCPTCKNCAYFSVTTFLGIPVCTNKKHVTPFGHMAIEDDDLACEDFKPNSSNQLEDLAKKYADPDGHKVNNPANFCGNCAKCEQHPNDVYICKHYYKKIVDPDDASCSHFKPNDGVVIGKPEFPCCEHCSHEDCDDCTLCPF